MKFSYFMRAFLGNSDSDSGRIPASTSKAIVKDSGVVDAVLIETPSSPASPIYSEPAIEPKDFTNYADYRSAGGTLTMHGNEDSLGWFDEKRW